MRHRGRVPALLVGFAALPTLLTVSAAPAGAAEADIEEVVVVDGTAEVLFSLPDLPDGVVPDVDTLVATVDGEPQQVEATLAADDDSIRRQTVLVMDTSDSMAGQPFDAARDAALAFVDQAPADVEIGLVTFAGEVTTVEEPTTDREALRDAIVGLGISRFTRLYEGIQTGEELVRDPDVQSNLLVLSDGADTSGNPVGALLDTLRTVSTRVDVIALGQSGESYDVLAQIARAGSGEVTNTDDPEALQALFESQAQLLSSQLLLRFEPTVGAETGDVNLEVTVDADGEGWTDTALVRFVGVRTEEQQKADDDRAARPLPAEAPLFEVTRPMMLGGLGALAIGGILLVGLMTGAFAGGPRKKSVQERIKPYGTDGVGAGVHPTADAGVVTKAVDATDKLIKGGGLDVKLARKLDAAGMSLHAAEWLLLHAGIAVGSAALGFAFAGPLFAVVGLVVGALLPRMYLSHKESRRIKAFDGQLADTLQLISGSLSAGLSLTQSLDTVVKEGQEPVAGEFRRALVEQRLGVEVETALEGVAERMRSDDFAWVVMAVRIQREVGGNLAELLLTVAGTLREREYLRRQVKTLSAEGKMSAWILGGLPPGFFAYLMLVQPTYLEPMLAAPLGWMMLGAAGVMMALGVVVMKQMIKVEV